MIPKLEYKSVEEQALSALLVPASIPFLNGFPKAFAISHCNQHHHLVQQLLLKINKTILQYWPCTTALVLGYGLAIFTLGLSLLIPRVCVMDCHQAVKKRIKGANRELVRVGLQAALIWEGCSCRIQIRSLDDFQSFVSQNHI